MLDRDDDGDYDYSLDTGAVRRAAALIDRVYKFNDVGGGLHAIVDDWNFEDDDLAGERWASDDDTPAQIAAENECLTALRSLSGDERASALSMSRARRRNTLDDSPTNP